MLTRAAVLAEGVPGGFAAVYGELRLMEEAGICRRGYFVDGLGGAQFALPAAVERLRDLRERPDRASAVVLSAVDPANPYGAAAAWPEAVRRPARAAGAWVVLVGGRPGLYVERGGRGLVGFDLELRAPAVAALAAAVRAGRIRRLAPRADRRPTAGRHRDGAGAARPGFLQGHRRPLLRA